jgi:hypothetical protein
MRQMPNLRYTARGLPHSWQRLSWRELNFGFRRALAILDLLATCVCFPVVDVVIQAGGLGDYATAPSRRNGMPKPRNNSRESSLEFDEVQIVIFIP